MQRAKGRAIDIVYDSSDLKSCDFDEYTGEIPPIESNCDSIVYAQSFQEITPFRKYVAVSILFPYTKT